jgi:hypothetical protein
VSVSAERLVLRRCAFWCSLAGKPEGENESSVTVQVPRANLFDVAAVTGLMRAINEGKPFRSADLTNAIGTALNTAAV